MSVLLETSLGDLVIDLEVDACPKTCENFLKLCKIYYYNLNAFFNVSKDFLAQAGDPTATGTGGESVWSVIATAKSVPRYFAPELLPKLKHTHRGTVSMAIAPALEGQAAGCGSQFFITLGDNIDYLDGKHAVFGHVVEGLDTLDRLNEVYVDQEGRPLKDVRIRHVVILDDPFPDPPGLVKPPSSPIRPPDNSTRIAEDEDPLATLPEEDEERIRREKAAAASALTLEMVGDLPFANVRPPENVLFVCKLNPVTRDEDLELIFSRFGTIMSCQVIRDKKTGDSLQYAFIEFDKRDEAEAAYFKMQNVLVDDRRIWVDLEVPAGTEALPVEKTSNRQEDTELMALAMIAMTNMAWSLTFPVVAMDIAENAAEAERRTAFETIVEGDQGRPKQAVVVDAGVGVEAEIVILGGHGAIDHQFHGVCS
ncbi:hypothetical protein CCMSSC00406_0001263 [Pleurotus cornucopiae]|uniref:Uncharacterized protein n=1 Tax=Pleurotus cornucopiae TaxID=5321 RepID=A0ACB7IM73_PLECO|nr:hypothetical protein CCMSSC00406_0001263 [Pleurotus cornucopiae]